RITLAEVTAPARARLHGSGCAASRTRRSRIVAGRTCQDRKSVCRSALPSRVTAVLADAVLTGRPTAARLPGRTGAVVEHRVDGGVEHPDVAGRGLSVSAGSVAATPTAGGRVDGGRVVGGRKFGGESRAGLPDRDGHGLKLGLGVRLGDGGRFGVAVDDGQLRGR